MLRPLLFWLWLLGTCACDVPPQTCKGVGTAGEDQCFSDADCCRGYTCVGNFLTPQGHTVCLGLAGADCFDHSDCVSDACTDTLCD